MSASISALLAMLGVRVAGTHTYVYAIFVWIFNNCSCYTTLGRFGRRSQFSCKDEILITMTVGLVPKNWTQFFVRCVTLAVRA